MSRPVRRAIRVHEIFIDQLILPYVPDSSGKKYGAPADPSQFRDEKASLRTLALDLIFSLPIFIA